MHCVLSLISLFSFRFYRFSIEHFLLNAWIVALLLCRMPANVIKECLIFIALTRYHHCAIIIHVATREWLFFFILSTDNCLYQNSHRLFYKAFLRKYEIWFASVWKRENFIKYFSQLLKSLWTNFCFISLNTNRYSNDKIFIFFFFKFCIYLVVVSLSLMGILRSSTNQLFRHVPKTQTFYFDRHYDSFLFDFHFIVCWRYFFLHSVSFDIINKMNGTVFYFDAMSISFSVLVFFNADHCHRSSYLLFESF